MALPASGPISSSMIAAEFSASQAPSGPDISLKGLASELSTPVTSDIFMGNSFYGESAGVTVVSFLGTEKLSNGSQACAADIEITYYHSGTGDPSVNETVYTDNPGTTPVSAGAIAFLNASEVKQALIINSSGLITSIDACKSDRRLKHNIVFRTYSKSGIPVYEFEYIDKTDGEGTYMGTMAQDLIKLGREDAVLMSEDKSHYLVDYSKIDVDFYKI